MSFARCFLRISGRQIRACWEVTRTRARKGWGGSRVRVGPRAPWTGRNDKLTYRAHAGFNALVRARGVSVVVRAPIRQRQLFAPKKYGHSPRTPSPLRLVSIIPLFDKVATSRPPTLPPNLGSRATQHGPGAARDSTHAQTHLSFTLSFSRQPLLRGEVVARSKNKG